MEEAETPAVLAARLDHGSTAITEGTPREISFGKISFGKISFGKINTLGVPPAIAEGVPRDTTTSNTEALKYLQSLKAALHTTVSCKSELSRNVCAHCHREFGCRGALFSHIRKEGHAAFAVRPRDGIAFTDHALEAATLAFFRSLLEGSLEAELPKAFAASAPSVDIGTLAAFIDSGESMLTVMVARLLTCPPHGESRKVLLGLLGRLLAEDERAAATIWQSAKDFELFSIPTKSTTSLLAWASTPDNATTSNGSTQPVYRPRSMWGLPDDIADLSPIGLARRDAALEEDSEAECGCTGLLAALLPADFAFEEDCVVCAGKTFLCCGPEGSLARVEGCGCVTCPESMVTWIQTQVDTEQKGTGEVCCAGCHATLSQSQLDAFCPAAATVAERIGVEKALVAMPDWKWCAAGCGGGGFLTGMGLSAGCRTTHCPTCDTAACVDCGVVATFHATASGEWRSCADAISERDGTAATKAWLSKSTKRCPPEHGGCGALTQRDGGCSHISCRVCKFQWCWLCEGKYKGKYTMGTVCPCGS
jgi:hypothetical protein